MLRDWFVGSLQVLQSASQPEKWHSLPAMDMQYFPKSPKIFESYELSNKISTNLDMHLFFKFVRIIYSDVFFLMTRSWVHVENMYFY